MTTYYLRVEGVNLDAVLDDTDQLSVVRGGSLLLRKAVKDLAGQTWSTIQTIEPISTGASVGLFKIACNMADTEKVCDEVAKWLNSQYQYLTFVVDLQADKNGFLKAKEAAIARNRFRQFQQLSVAVPDHNAVATIEPCGWDAIRPGDHPIPVKRDNEDIRLSLSTRSRYDYGLGQKKMFYEEEAGISDAFAYDLHQIADNEDYGNLNGKIAVIYFDGNKFATIQREHCNDAQKQSEFDTELQSLRQGFLKDFYTKIKDNNQAWRGKDDKGKNVLRLETLLWGGDEISLVVPAWKGFWTLHTFFELSQNWKFKGTPLTHAGGLVFCPKKTPIHRAKRLAHDLAGTVKEELERITRRENLYDYVVLETIDFLTEPVNEFRKRVFGDTLSSKRSPLAPVRVNALRGLSELLDETSKAQAYPLARAIIGGDSKEINARLKRFEEVSERFMELKDKMRELFPGTEEHWSWVHLVDLWDYLDPTPEEPGQ